MTQIIGYARVSSVCQNLDSQIDRLKEAGCEKIFSDKITGTSLNRPGWDELNNYIRSGDFLIITELSRMSRSGAHLIQIVEDLRSRDINLKSLTEHIDTTTAMGRGLLSISAAITQMEHEVKKERAEAGRAAAKARGKTGGRPRIDKDKVETAIILYKNSDKTANEVCAMYGFTPRTLYKYINKQIQGNS